MRPDEVPLNQHKGVDLMKKAEKYAMRIQ